MRRLINVFNKTCSVTVKLLESYVYRNLFKLPRTFIIGLYDSVWWLHALRSVHSFALSLSLCLTGYCNDLYVNKTILSK